MTPRWLNRRIARPGPFLALCLSDTEFNKVVARLKCPIRPRWVIAGADATMHTFEHEDGGTACVVCLSGTEGRNPIEVAGLLIHEAVHVWQQYCEDAGEHRPGSEQEAYGIQSIAQELLAEYARRLSVCQASPQTRASVPAGVDKPS